MQMSVFALSVTPYITSSIIMQLMTIAIPALEEMQKDGEDGRKKIAKITRYVTVVFTGRHSVRRVYHRFQPQRCAGPENTEILPS